MWAALIAAPLFALQQVALLMGNGLAALAVILLVFALVGSLFLVGLVHALSNAVGTGSGFRDGSLRVLCPADAEIVGVLHIAALALIGLVVMARTIGGSTRTAGSTRDRRAVQSRRGRRAARA